MFDGPAVVLITGVMASGKSSVAEALARELPRTAHVRGDAFRRMIVSGRAEMTNPLSDAARAQLELRQRLAAEVAIGYRSAGFIAVLQDIYLGEDLARMAERLAGGPLYVVVLAPRPEIVAARESARAKRGYGEAWSVEAFDRLLREETPRLGYWLDTSELDIPETVASILANGRRALWRETERRG